MEIHSLHFLSTEKSWGMKLWWKPSFFTKAPLNKGTKDQYKADVRGSHASLWSCIGVISLEGPCPCTSFLSTLSFTPVGHKDGQSSSLGGRERLRIQGTSPGKAGSEVTTGLWPEEGGSCKAKRLFWHHDWAPRAKVPYPYYMHQGAVD